MNKDEVELSVEAFCPSLVIKVAEIIFSKKWKLNLLRKVFVLGVSSFFFLSPFSPFSFFRFPLTISLSLFFFSFLQFHSDKQMKGQMKYKRTNWCKPMWFSFVRQRKEKKILENLRKNDSNDQTIETFSNPSTSQEEGKKKFLRNLPPSRSICESFFLPSYTFTSIHSILSPPLDYKNWEPKETKSTFTWWADRREAINCHWWGGFHQPLISIGGWETKLEITGNWSIFSWRPIHEENNSIWKFNSPQRPQINNLRKGNPVVSKDQWHPQPLY